MDSPVMTEGESGEGIKGIRVRVRVEEGGEGGGVWTDGRTDGLLAYARCVVEFLGLVGDLQLVL